MALHSYVRAHRLRSIFGAAIHLEARPGDPGVRWLGLVAATDRFLAHGRDAVGLLYWRSEEGCAVDLSARRNLSFARMRAGMRVSDVHDYPRLAHVSR